MDIPNAVIDVIRTAAAFEDTVQRVGTEELAEAASRLDTVHLAYLLDRLDDTRASVAEILSAMLDKGLTALNDAAPTLSEVYGDLESAGEGLYDVVNELDPESARHNLTVAGAPTPTSEYTAEDYIAAANTYYATTDAMLPARPTFCPECGEDTPAESDYNADHVYADNGVLLIGCEGYHVQDPNSFGIAAPDWQDWQNAT
jgi:hypothetical protein